MLVPCIPPTLSPLFASTYIQCGRPGFHPWVWKICSKRKWQSTPVLLSGKSHGQRSLVGYSPWGRKESDMTERLHVHFHMFFLPPFQYPKQPLFLPSNCLFHVAGSFHHHCPPSWAACHFLKPGFLGQYPQ